MSRAARLPVLAWAHRHAAGSLKGLSWVDAQIRWDGDSFQQRESDGQRRFRHMPYGAFVPAAMAEEARRIQCDGGVPALEAIMLLFAPVEWAIAGRHLLWSPLSPFPSLLKDLVESFGIGAQLHHGDQELLAVLAARLPIWFPQRGSVESARTLASICTDFQPTLCEGREASTLEEEVLINHQLSWWRARMQTPDAVVHRIEGGVVRFQHPGPPRVRCRPEDVVVTLAPGETAAAEIFRLLPVWTAVRLVLCRGGEHGP